MLVLLALAAPAPAAEGDANAIFLVAGPELIDPNFRETVVLVAHPREGPPWGVIINRPLEHPLSEVFTEIETLKDLIRQAKAIVEAESETKLRYFKDSLTRLDQQHPNSKILIFTESRDTLTHLEKHVRDKWGYSVCTIHGGMRLEERVAKPLRHPMTTAVGATGQLGVPRDFDLGRRLGGDRRGQREPRDDGLRIAGQRRCDALARRGAVGARQRQQRVQRERGRVLRRKTQSR